LARADLSFVVVIMVTSSRLAWILEQLQSGRQARIAISTHVDRVVVKICLLPCTSLEMRNHFAIMWVSSILEHLGATVAVDHGHLNSKQESHISITLRPIPGYGVGVSHTPGGDQHTEHAQQLPDVESSPSDAGADSDPDQSCLHTDVAGPAVPGAALGNTSAGPEIKRRRRNANSDTSVPSHACPAHENTGDIAMGHGSPVDEASLLRGLLSGESSVSSGRVDDGERTHATARGGYTHSDVVQKESAASGLLPPGPGSAASFKYGELVELVNLASSTLNGAWGRIASRDVNDAGRYQVKLVRREPDSYEEMVKQSGYAGTTKLVKPSNLRSVFGSYVDYHLQDDVRCTCANGGRIDFCWAENDDELCEVCGAEAINVYACTACKLVRCAMCVENDCRMLPKAHAARDVFEET
jgi:hypothetical protein